MDAATHGGIDVARQIAYYHEQGYAIVESVLPPAQLANLRASFDEVVTRESELGRQRGWQNDVYRCIYNFADKSAPARALIEQPHFLAFLSAVLGETFVVSSLNSIAMTPGGKDQELHIDQDESTPGMAIFSQAIFTFDDFTIKNGCTRVIPGSHREIFRYGDYMQNFDAIEARTVRLQAPAGSIIFWQGGLWHAGSANRTTRPRRCITMYCCRHWARTQIDQTRSLSPETIATLSETQKRRLGFYSQPGWYDRARDEYHLPKV